MRLMHVIVLLTLVSGLHACSPGSPGMKGKGGNSSSDSNSGDSASIDRPAMVGGGYVTGYLSCYFDAKVAEDATEVGFKCRFENAGEKISLPENSAVNHAVYDVNDNRLQEVVLSAEEADSSSHWRGSVPRALAANLRVESTLNYGENNVLRRSTYVSDPPNTSGNDSTQQRGSVNLVGATHTYIFGSLTDTPACTSERQKGGDTATFVEPNLQSLTLVFNAPNNTFIDVDLFYLCNLEKSEPLVQLFRFGEKKALKKASLAKESGLNDQRVLKRFELKAGRYELQILMSEKWEDFGKNAFSLGDIQITSSQAIDSHIEVRPSKGPTGDIGPPSPGKKDFSR